MALDDPVIICIQDTSSSAMFNPLHNSMNQQLFEKLPVSNHYENTEDFSLWKEAITCHHQIDTFRCQQRWMEHKGGH